MAVVHGVCPCLGLAGARAAPVRPGRALFGPALALRAVRAQAFVDAGDRTPPEIHAAHPGNAVPWPFHRAHVIARSLVQLLRWAAASGCELGRRGRVRRAPSSIGCYRRLSTSLSSAWHGLGVPIPCVRSRGRRRSGRTPRGGGWWTIRGERAARLRPRGEGKNQKKKKTDEKKRSSASAKRRRFVAKSRAAGRWRRESQSLVVCLPYPTFSFTTPPPTLSQTSTI